MSIRKPRGTKDIYGENASRFFWICGLIKEKLRSYSYSEVSTPIFEDIQVFAANDEESLAANKEFFYVSSKSSEEEMVLRPENTASIVRFVSESKLLKNNPVVLSYFYCGPFFRYERPQKDRFRQFTQMGIERINATSISYDIENILLMEEISLMFGGLDWKLHLNYLGSMESKKKWSQRLREYFLENRDQLSSSEERILNNPLRILDDREDSEKEVVRNSPPIDEFLSEEERKEKELIREKLDDLGIEYIWDETLIRGIDYYDGLVYEWKKNGLAIASGGRYNELFRRFEDQTYPSLGLAMGIDRLQSCLEEMGFSWPPFDEKTVFLLVPNEFLKESIDLSSKIRAGGFRVFSNGDGLETKQGIRMAERMNMKWFMAFESEGIFVQSLVDWNSRKKFRAEEIKEILEFINE